MTAECSALIRRKRQLSCFIFHPPESISLRGGHRLVQATLPHIIHLNPAAAVFINTMGIIFLFQRGFNRSLFQFFSFKTWRICASKGKEKLAVSMVSDDSVANYFPAFLKGRVFFSRIRTARLFITRFTIDIILNIVW